MAAINLVVDTNIFIEHLRSKNKQETNLFLLSEKLNLFISAVTLYELYMGATTDEKRNDVQLLTNDITILPFNKEVAEQASLIYSDLRKANQLIEFRDIFIAATCIVYNFPLKTLNAKHFMRINGLVIQ